MSATATASYKSPSHTHSHSHSRSSNTSHSHSHSRSSRPSTTPRAHPNPVSVGQSIPPSGQPLLTPTPNHRPSQVSINPKSPSPSYFGFVVGNDDSIPPDSNPGNHARQNWNSSQSSFSTPRPLALEADPEFEAFRRQSDHNHRFQLNSSSSSLGKLSQSTRTISSTSFTSPIVSLSKRPALETAVSPKDQSRSQDVPMEGMSFFDIPRQESPVSFNLNRSVTDLQHARLSLPLNGVLSAPAFNHLKQPQKSNTLPTPTDKDSSPLVSPIEIGDLLRNCSKDTLVLDLRVYQHYASARLQGALNLCIPTTLLKRPAYNVQRLAETFTSETDKDSFSRWRRCKHIVVYDATSSLMKEAATPLNVLKKFTAEGWAGNGYVIKGGFLAFSKMLPELIDSSPLRPSQAASPSPLNGSSELKDVLPVAGGCAMPTEQSAANPFFGNIRQNMDLLDGVGQLPIKKPSNMSQSAEKSLPEWLRQASAKSDEGKAVSERFLRIEKHEQQRMQEALRAQVSYGTPQLERPKNIQVAGIEKGSKNRYNNIFPYDHTRVKLQNVPSGACDYINASHVKAQFSHRQYIATQAPIPATFNDFWKVVWEQDVRVIVMLTAESEGGQIKSHRYWNPGEYGSLKLKQLSEKVVGLENKKSAKEQISSSTRPSLGARRSTTANISGDKKLDQTKSWQSATSSVTVRHFTLSHASYPFQPMREIVQIQYADWPDLGTPASPSELLALVEQVNKYVRSSTPTEMGPDEAAHEGQRPILVHCSAGCGRTGTFCTIDSVIDMLKRQHLSDRGGSGDKMDVDGGDDWICRDDVDLVAKTVDDFRHQRLSMVQNLRQFVLCYESVLQWIVGQETGALSPRRPGMGEKRRSYQESCERR